jgi:hypothetical protein
MFLPGLTAIPLIFLQISITPHREGGAADEEIDGGEMKRLQVCCYRDIKC